MYVYKLHNCIYLMVQFSGKNVYILLIHFLQIAIIQSEFYILFWLLFLFTFLRQKKSEIYT